MNIEEVQTKGNFQMDFFKIRKHKGNVKQHITMERVERLYLFETVSWKIMIPLAVLLGILIWIASPKPPTPAETKTVQTDQIRKPSAANKEEREIITGPRGGQFYINQNGNRSYVPRSKAK